MAPHRPVQIHSAHSIQQCSFLAIQIKDPTCQGSALRENTYGLARGKHRLTKMSISFICLENRYLLDAVSLIFYKLNLTPDYLPGPHAPLMHAMKKLRRILPFKSFITLLKECVYGILASCYVWYWSYKRPTRSLKSSISESI